MKQTYKVIGVPKGYEEENVKNFFCSQNSIIYRNFSYHWASFLISYKLCVMEQFILFHLISVD